jgi:hypothetical protein
MRRISEPGLKRNEGSVIGSGRDYAQYMGKLCKDDGGFYIGKAGRVVRRIRSGDKVGIYSKLVSGGWMVQRYEVCLS